MKNVKYIALMIFFSLNSIAGKIDLSKKIEIGCRAPAAEHTVWEQISSKACEYAGWAKSGLDVASVKSAEYVSPVIAAAVAAAVPAVLEVSAQVSTPESAKSKRVAYMVISAVSGALALLSFNGVQK